MFSGSPGPMHLQRRTHRLAVPVHMLQWVDRPFDTLSCEILEPERNGDVLHIPRDPGPSELFGVELAYHKTIVIVN